MEKVKNQKIGYVIATLVAIALMFIFLFVLATVYLPKRVSDVNEDIIKERLNKLAAVNAKQAEQVSSYVWVDKEKGIVKIPIEEAMKLTVVQLNKERVEQKTETK